MECAFCNSDIRKDELLVCTSCGVGYHFRCLNITYSDFHGHINKLRETWLCDNCKNITRRLRNDDTPIRSLKPGHLDMSCDSVGVPAHIDSDGSASLLSNALSKHFSLDDISKLLDAKLDAIKLHLSNEIVSAIENLKSDLAQTTEMLASRMADINQDVSSIKNRVEILENENALLRVELTSLKEKGISYDSSPTLDLIQNLQNEINDQEQSTLMNDIELSCIPEFEGESLWHIALAVAKKLAVDIDERDLICATRVGSKLKSPNVSESRHQQRPRPIVIRLARKTLRDDFLKNARVRRGATTDDLGLPPHNIRTFYVNERLTKRNRILLAKARERGRGLHWKFVWSKEGRIYAKQSDSTYSAVNWIRSEKDIERVFCSNSNELS